MIVSLYKNEYYPHLDYLRVFSCIGIIMMHVLENGYQGLKTLSGVCGILFKYLIPSFTNLVFLFMIISSFSLLNGHYREIKTGCFSIENFYIRRYQKIWPFFALLCTIELIVSHSLDALYEWFADLTLAFGLLPNSSISVVGVGWFLGVIFAFYMVFPFFVFLLGNKKRGLLTFLACILLNLLCQIYFMDDQHVHSSFSERTNLLYCAMFFVAGGLIYLYRESLDSISPLLFLIFSICSIPFIYIYRFALIYAYLFMFSSILIVCSYKRYAKIRIKFFGFQKIVYFLSKISIEIYLCHMFVYRTLEKFRLLYLSDNLLISYLMTLLFTFYGAVSVSYLFWIFRRSCKRIMSLEK